MNKINLNDISPSEFESWRSAALLETFVPVIDMPKDALLLDLSRGNDPRNQGGGFSIGKYAEKRRGMYTAALFAGARDFHIGLDLGAPVGTPICLFTDGEVVDFVYRSEPGDYGNTIITKHFVGGRDLWALFGHLQSRSLTGLKKGKKIAKGETFAFVGDIHENGGWEHSHLHLQLSLIEPKNCDMPGTVTDAQIPWALRVFPDPRLVMGPIY